MILSMLIDRFDDYRATYHKKSGALLAYLASAAHQDIAEARAGHLGCARCETAPTHDSFDEDR